MARKRRRREAQRQETGTRLAVLPLDEISGGMIDERARQSALELAPLAASIARCGLLSPLVVRCAEGARGYRLVCGARRLAACRMLGLAEVPAVIIDADETEAVACFMEEHLLSRPPCAMEEAGLLSSRGGAYAAGESVLPAEAFARRLSLLALDEGTRRIALENALSLEQVEPLLSIKREDWRQEAAQIIADRQLTGAQARRLVFGPRAGK